MQSSEHTYCPNQAAPYLYADTEDSRYIVKARCKLWSCPYCGKVNAHQHYIRILNGINQLQSRKQQLSFVTLTSHERIKTTESCLAIWRKSWRSLRERYRRIQEKSADYPLAFCIVSELHKDKRLHWHIICTYFVKSRWWKDNARSCGLGHQAKSIELDNAAQGANYITKYLAKSLTQMDYPKKMRRVVYSQTFPSKPDGDVAYVWSILDPKDSIVDCIESGWRRDLDTFLNWQEITEILTE